MSRLLAPLQRLRTLGEDRSGAALLEFAFALPLILTMGLTGAEITNYIITKMRISQISLHLADNAARIGAGSQLQAKTINEADIRDLFTGAQLQSGELDLLRNGRVILSSVEPSTINTANSRIRWQRCFGSKTSYTSSYGTTATTNVPGVGPSGRTIAASASGVVMFVEVQYEYQPLIRTSLSPDPKISETASMMVRDRRDTIGGNNGVYPTPGVTPATC